MSKNKYTLRRIYPKTKFQANAMRQYFFHIGTCQTFVDGFCTYDILVCKKSLIACVFRT